MNSHVRSHRGSVSRGFANIWDTNRTFRNIDIHFSLNRPAAVIDMGMTCKMSIQTNKAGKCWKCALCTENLKYLDFVQMPHARIQANTLVQTQQSTGRKQTKPRNWEAQKINNTGTENTRPTNTPSNKPNCKAQWQLSTATCNHKLPSLAGLTSSFPCLSILCTSLTVWRVSPNLSANRKPTWSDDKIVISHPPLPRAYPSHLGDACRMEKYNASRSGYLPKFHEMLRLPWKVALQLDAPTFSPLLYSILLYYSLRDSTRLYYSLFSTLRDSSILYYSLLYSTRLYYHSLLDSTILYSILLFSTNYSLLFSTSLSQF